MSTSKRSSQEQSQGSRKPSLKYRIKIVWFYLCSWVKLAWWVEDQLLKLSPEARRLKQVEADFKAEGKSPATLLDEAEKRAKALEAQIAMIHKLFAEAQSYSQGELLSEISLVVDWARPVETSPKYDPDWFKNEQN